MPVSFDDAKFGLGLINRHGVNGGKTLRKISLSRSAWLARVKNTIPGMMAI